MGTASVLSRTLFGRTRGAVLAVLYGHVGDSFHLRQLSRLTKITLGAVQRELRQLVDAGLVTRRASGNQVLYSANDANPVFTEMKSLVTKTVGIHDVLLAALHPLKERISVAFIYGSTARLKENNRSDVDLMIVGKVHFPDVIEHLADAQKTLNREINPTVYSTREFGKKFRGNFLKTVLSEDKLFLIGDESVVRELGQK
jgi:DNA-binding transcriptional ArsR family regulator